MSDRKRGPEEDGGPAAKKPRSDTPAASNGATPPGGLDTAALIAQKRAEIAAKYAALKKNGIVPSAAPSASPSATVSAPPTPATPSALPSGAAMPTADELARRVAEAKRKVAERQNKLSNPYAAGAQSAKKKGTPAPEPAPQGAGLKMAAHPLLLDTTPSAPQSKKDRYKPMQPKFASIKANIRNAPTPLPAAAAPVPVAVIEARSNPYASGSITPASEGGFEGTPRERVGRSFKFNTKGKYVQIANQLRQEAQLEELKQRIAANARKAGLDTEFETLEKNIKREAPPEAEWWDVALLPNKTYDDLALGIDKLNIHADDSPITIYVQHPIPIPPPGDKSQPSLKPLKLTTREQKKMRKQRRQAELQDKRDRIRMGLIPPDPPKVRLANLMKVLTSDAVQDPTKVEARVRREVAMRKHNHEKMNTERKLTDDQRREKIEAKKAEEDKKGIVGAVFKIKNLSDPAHRFKVRKNAEQLNLTGVVIFNPHFGFVYVEGAPRFMRNYKRLMLQRIAWTEAARPRGAEDVEVEERGDDEGVGKDKEKAEGNEGEEQANLEDNRCDLVWEGQLRERAFNGFKPRSCPTDGLAKEVLGPKLAGYWDSAKNFKPAEDEFF